jgi:alkylhydroperoxidase family enzyme
LALADPDLVEAVLTDWSTAPVSPQLRATLAFVQTQALEPEQLSRNDLEAVRAAGVSEGAIRDAIYICGAFSILTRIADAFGAVPASELLPADVRSAYTARFLSAGYC